MIVHTCEPDTRRPAWAASWYLGLACASPIGVPVEHRRQAHLADLRPGVKYAGHIQWQVSVFNVVSERGELLGQSAACCNLPVQWVGVQVFDVENPQSQLAAAPGGRMGSGQ